MVERTSEKRVIVLLFLAAVALRWGYAATMHHVLGQDGLQLGDSHGYVVTAGLVASAIQAGTISGWDWLGPDLSIMPLIVWLWTGSILAFGKFAVEGFIAFQGLADAATCVLIYGIAKSIRPDFALPAGMAAAINPTQIILAGLFYTDTTFLFFSTLVLFLAARWMQSPSRLLAISIGVAVGCAAMTRILIVPWAACLLGLLLLVDVVRKRPIAESLRQLASAAAIALVLVSPVVARNVLHYHAWALTAQTGGHTAFWIVPLVKQTADGTPWEKGADQMKAREASANIASDGNPFERSRRLSELGAKALHELGTAAVIKAWVFGAAINLGSPAVALSPPVIGMPRTGFYATPGDTPVHKVVNFLFHSDNRLYAWIILAGTTGLGIMRLIQLVGVAVILGRLQNLPALLLLGSWCVYILLVNGPVASPKYRLPVETPMMVFAGAGICALRDWRRRRNPVQAVA